MDTAGCPPEAALLPCLTLPVTTDVEMFDVARDWAMIAAEVL